MSYILEALKKAQAERQLGATPTLDAQPVHPPLPARIRRPRAPAVAGAVAAVLTTLAVALLTQWWRAPQPQPQPPSVVVASPAPASAAAPAIAPALAAAPAAAPAPAPAAAPAAASAPAPVVVASAPSLVVAPPSAPVREVVKAAPVAVAVAKPAPEAPAASPPAAPPAPPLKPAEASLPTLRELPDNVRATIPPLSFGGYMYSNNPSDRLILVDKVLRHEGEEVAPGLVLEKLLPKAAQMNYRGTRYLVPI